MVLLQTYNHNDTYHHHAAQGLRLQDTLQLKEQPG